MITPQKEWDSNSELKLSKCLTTSTMYQAPQNSQQRTQRRTRAPHSRYVQFDVFLNWVHTFPMISLDSRKPEVSESRVQSWQNSWKPRANLTSKDITRERDVSLPSTWLTQQFSGTEETHQGQSEKVAAGSQNTQHRLSSVHFLTTIKLKWTSL